MDRKRLIFLICCVSLFWSLSYVSAGTILSSYKYAWSDKMGYINFESVVIGDSALSGYAWSENAGWIKFNPSQGGVLNDGNGNLSGSAWGEKLGWIDFDNTTINISTGKFSGTATGPLVGTITFDCSNYCDVRTDWRPGGTPMCTSWTYSSWSTCSGGQQTRTILSSSPASCTGGSPVLSQSCSSGGGGGGGGGGPLFKPPIVPKDTLPPEDNSPHPDCPLASSPTFKDFKDYLVCNSLITKRKQEIEYEYEKYAPRKELLGVAVSMFLKNTHSRADHIKDMSLYHSPYFLDVGLQDEPAWVLQTVERGIMFDLITTKNSLFRPDETITRAEAFAMLMKSVCMNPSENSSLPWEQKVYNTAKRNGITVRSWEEFFPRAPILRQDFFVISTKLDTWVKSTGGCNAKSTDTSSNTTPSDKDINISLQAPGTFELLYENDAEKIYAYIIKNGGIPDGVRLQYIKTFGAGKNLAKNIFIQNISGEEFAEDRWLLAGEIVYVHIKKERSKRDSSL